MTARKNKSYESQIVSLFRSWQDGIPESDRRLVPQKDLFGDVVQYVEFKVQEIYELWLQNYRLEKQIPNAVRHDHPSLREAFEKLLADNDLIYYGIKTQEEKGEAKNENFEILGGQKTKAPKGVRYNAGKFPLGMILEGRNALEGCAAVMAFGAKKYSRSNWRKGLSQTQVADSLSRHLVAWISGEDLDPESGLPHLDHLLCNAIFLSEVSKTRPDLDDRPFKDGQFTSETDVI